MSDEDVTDHYLTDRPLPSDQEAERMIIGAIILNNILIHQAAEMTRSGDYSNVYYRRIFLAMLSLSKRNSELDPVLIIDEIKLQGEIAPPLIFFMDLIRGLPRIESLKSYARIIRGKALLSDLIREQARSMAECYAQDDIPEAIVDKTQRNILEISSEARAMSGVVRSYKEIAVSVNATFDLWEKGELASIPTQIPEIDDHLIYGGLALGDFIVIAAQTSYGKTALALQIALGAARTRIPVLILSLEMKGERLFIRNLASVSQVARRDISPVTFRKHQTEITKKIRAAVPKLEDAPIYVVDRVRSLERLSSVAVDWKLRTCGSERTGLIIVDYMQLVQNQLSRRSREEEVTGISRELKNLAGQLNVPVAGLSQFNRVPSKADARPELKDLRESGAIEQDTDLALFIWSPNKIKEAAMRAVKVYCPKQRDGPVGWEEDIDFDADHQWFRSDQMWRPLPEEGVDLNA